ncbi:molybdopterin-synthase adenylyltransferase MoeB [Hydrogenophaga sp.]|uniref:molybdopterin-synthase adenylyltransferase MoeB n=1 Tax=Hydrogenophaga sp. TaxID=1904254 RepID=UPI00271F237B|nr:molybdopterin-synthase adenylyltransferase MoeB [Hydrogenophaga sp.]MDO9438839.1 molybdopterin-synthase adenylyltransferase MoeB [Hydrogenophaga sp.]
MAQIFVRVPSLSRASDEAVQELQLEAITLGDALKAISAKRPELLDVLWTSDGELNPLVNVIVGQRDVRALGGLSACLADGDVVSIAPEFASSTTQGRLAHLRSRITKVDPLQAHALQTNGAAIVDVREPSESAIGTALGAFVLGRSFLEIRIEQAIDKSRTVIVMCQSGTRSLFAADDLARLGYEDIRSLAGGFELWKQQGLPIEVQPRLDDAARERYSRHLLMPEVGEAGQMKLMKSKVLMIGVGGLGSPAAYYLAAAGIGTIGLVDHDVVDRSNLQRQILHTDARVGKSKVESAKATLEALNPTIKVIGHEEHLNAANVEQILTGYDVIVDGTDNFPTRYLINDACVKLKLPNVHGAVFRFDGQVSVFWPGRPKLPGPCYRCMFPEPPPPGTAPSCAEAGVLGVLPGVIGLLQATEVVKLVLGLGDPLVGRILHFDALRAKFLSLKLDANPECPCCGVGRNFEGYKDYAQSCSNPNLSEINSRISDVSQTNKSQELIAEVK